MQKKYQVFVSSTFRDLVDERQDTLRHILDLGHIPAGMELFPASNAEQLEYIKKIIDECDYYVLIIGGRYGSMDNDGVSFTDREYEYAIESGKPVLAFIHGDPGKLAVENSDIDQRILARLSEFRERVAKGRLVQFWTSREGLALSVLKSLAKAFQESPQIGWIRASVAASEDLLQQINSLRNENDAINNEIAEIRKSQKPKIDGLAGLDEGFSVRFSTENLSDYNDERIEHKANFTWSEIFSIVGPRIISPSNPSKIKDAITAYLVDEKGSHYSTIIRETDADTIKMHLFAINFIDVYNFDEPKGGHSERVKITDQGKAALVELKAVKSIA